MIHDIQNWQLSIIPHAKVMTEAIAPRTVAEVQAFSPIPAAVPGNFELDLQQAGLLEDLYYADNVLKAQALENRHLWYTATFAVEPHPGKDTVLEFGGIDTTAEIFLDGELLGKTENMFIPHRFPVALAPGEHELVVHITPAQIAVRQYDYPASANALPYNYAQLMMRKAPHMYGWDIMPRIVSAGLWRPVTLHYLPKSRLNNVFLFTRRIENGTALLDCVLDWQTEEDFLQDFTVTVEGRCGEHTFSADKRLWCTHEELRFWVEEPKMWWPKNYGEPNLYNVTITLKKGEKTVDTYCFRTGIRTVELTRTSLAGKDGEFLFRVNGQRVFIMGTNWVPCDAYPSRDKEYVLRGLELVNDLGCNAIRCWGGNIYPDDALYDYCDAHGILIWQDFSMACAHYPDDERLCRLIEEEVTAVVRRLRNHPALLLWSGDNECDQMQGFDRAVFQDGRRINAMDPNETRLTREIIPRVLRREDFTRPYLPSSPYVDEVAFKTQSLISEDHLWGPRDFFKGEFYRSAIAHFASEIGYHGCPSPASLAKFLSPEALQQLGNGEVFENVEWRLHGSCASADYDYTAYRNPLMFRQVERLFGTASRDLNTFARQSQISQAEAKKFFIEHFRLAKWRRTGIIWWNVIDGWPQISDAIVDWYGTKKLAYHYIKRSQQPFCLMCDEPVDGQLTLMAVNDRRDTVKVRYTVTAVSSGKEIIAGEVTGKPDTAVAVATFAPENGEVYAIRWEGESCTGMNHYTAGIEATLDYAMHTEQMKALGFFDEFEGF